MTAEFSIAAEPLISGPQLDVLGGPVPEAGELGWRELALQTVLITAYTDHRGLEPVNPDDVPAALNECEKKIQLVLSTSEGREEFLGNPSRRHPVSGNRIARKEARMTRLQRRVAVLFDERRTLREPVQEVAEAQGVGPREVNNTLQQLFRRLAGLERSRPELFLHEPLAVEELRALLLFDSGPPRLTAQPAPGHDRAENTFVATNHRIGELLLAEESESRLHRWLLDSDRIRACIAPVLNALGEHEEQIVRRRLGFNGQPPQRVEAIAAEYEIHGSQMTRQLAQAFDKLCAVFENEALPANTTRLASMPLGARLQDFTPFAPQRERQLARWAMMGLGAQRVLDGPGLTTRARLELTGIAHAGARAQRDLVVGHQAMVGPIVRRYMVSGMSQEQLRQAGQRGLERAVQAFDATQAGRFYEHAIGWIRQAIEEAIQTGRIT